MYTVGHKKRATLFSIVPPAFLSRFLNFLFQSLETGTNTLHRSEHNLPLDYHTAVRRGFELYECLLVAVVIAETIVKCIYCLIFAAINSAVYLASWRKSRWSQRGTQYARIINYITDRDVRNGIF